MSSEAFLENLPLVRSNGTESRLRIRDVEIGGDTPIIIAGPCVVESKNQILQVAQFVKKNGAHGLRGGIFKPRSSPYSFQGLGREGLDYLVKAREMTGLFLTVEVTGVDQISEVLDYVDVLQVGARNMQNFELLKAVGQSHRPVLLKRGLAATIQELLQAAEYILREGNNQVLLCERGIRTFETMTRNTLDINAIPLLKKITHLPVIVDPSHGTGRSDLVIPVAKAALSAGADGLMIEVHPEPGQALSDGGQSLDFKAFKDLISQLPLHQQGCSPHEAKPRVMPDYDDFIKLAISGKYRYIPVYRELLSDTETPVTAFAKLTSGSLRFLLESVERAEQVGRYSFIGWDPLLLFKSKANTVTVTDLEGQTETIEGDPLVVLQQKMQELKVAPMARFENFYGGAVGFIGYDYVRQIEKLPAKNPAVLGIPESCWIVPRCLTCFDHVQHKIINIFLTPVGDDPKRAYQTAQNHLAQIDSKLRADLRMTPLDQTEETQNKQAEFSLTQTEYEEGVRRIKEYIMAGDAFQVVLSQRITKPFSGDPLFFYRLLRTINPSPYLFYFDFGGYQLAGSSPEVMVRFKENEVVLKPIAGTRPRGTCPSEDRDLMRELLADPKERAEHIMLVDLGRNDLGRVCKFGSVAVTELMNVENYSHVMHIVSRIQGELLPDLTLTDLVRAVFPAGTLSGAPKIRAMEIIEEIEPVRREFYGGAVGYIGFNQQLDTCITIRTVLFTEGRAHIQVGAGIVADSIPASEYQETMNKAGALLTALARAEGVTSCSL